MLKGQLLAHSQGAVSAPVHAPTSGVVHEIENHTAPHPSGLPVKTIVIKTDGEDRWTNSVLPIDPFQLSAEEIAIRVGAAGVVGMGGATFPAAVKLNLRNRYTIHTLVINGAECEPYLTCDDRLMRERSESIIDGIRIINLYVPNGSSIGSEKYEYKLQWFQVLKAYLDNLIEKESYELCICGDFNIALEDKDIYNPKGKSNHIMSSPLEREALQNILTIGLKDAFRKFTTEGEYFSWWDYRSGGFQRNRGWRIDHLYLTNKLYEKAIDCTIDIEPRKQERPSDHTPVILEI